MKLTQAIFRCLQAIHEFSSQLSLASPVISFNFVRIMCIKAYFYGGGASLSLLLRLRDSLFREICLAIREISHLTL